MGEANGEVNQAQTKLEETTVRSKMRRVFSFD
jgi:hypothetical protein